MGFYEKRKAQQSFNKKSTTERAIDRIRRTHKPIQEQVAPQAHPEILREQKERTRQLLSEPAPVVQEEQVHQEPVVDSRSHVEMMSDWISHSVKVEKQKSNPQAVRESFDLTDRIKLLEQDIFRIQAQGQPNTLVAGVGASLDSGGGAVWLWDLEDVNIGAPVNGQYPSISDGQSLVYDLATNKWIPGAGSGTTDITDITAKFLEFDGDQTVQAIRASGATGKQFDIEVGETKASASIVARFEPQKLTLPSGQLSAADVNTTTATIGTLNTGTIQGNRIGVLWKLSAGEGLAFDGQASGHIGGTPGETGGNAYNVGYGTIKIGPTVLQTTGNQTILGNKIYRGSTAEILSLQTKDSVQKLIEAGGGGLDFNFISDINVTATDPPTGVSAGDYYVNNTAGNAGANWTGIANEPIALNQLVIYTSANEWATGAEVDVSQYVPLAGTDAITGDLTSTAAITCAGLTTTTLQTTGNTVLGDDFDTLTVNGPATFTSNVNLSQSTLSVSNSAGSYITCSDTTTTPATNKFLIEHDGKASFGGIIYANAGVIVTDHQIKMLRAINTNRFIQGVFKPSGGSETTTFEVYGNGDITNAGDITTQGDNHTVGNLTLDGTVSSNLEPTGNQAYNLGKSGGKWNNAYINLGHFTNIDASGTLQVDGTSTFNGPVHLGNAASDIIYPAGVISGSLIPNNSTYNIGGTSAGWGTVYCSKVIASNEITVTNAVSAKNFSSTSTTYSSIKNLRIATGGKFSSMAAVEVTRSGSTGDSYFQIDGRTVISGGTDSILFEAKNKGSTQPDIVEYHGATDSSDSCIQTKKSLGYDMTHHTTLNSAQNGNFTDITGSSWHIVLKNNVITGMVLCYVSIYQSSANFTNGTKVAKITDSALLPGHVVCMPCIGDNNCTVNLKIATNGEITMHSIEGASPNTKNCNGSMFYPSTVFQKPA